MSPQRPPPVPSAVPKPVGGPETRRHERIDVRIGAELRFAGHAVDATTMNLSVGGVGVECGQELPEGEDLVLLLFVVRDDIEEERRPPLTVKAKVMWSAPAENPGELCKAGLRFESITPSQQDWLKLVMRFTGEQ